jgi:hypothetical protein
MPGPRTAERFGFGDVSNRRSERVQQRSVRRRYVHDGDWPNDKGDRGAESAIIGAFILWRSVEDLGQ